MSHFHSGPPSASPVACVARRFVWIKLFGQPLPRVYIVSDPYSGITSDILADTAWHNLWHKICSNTLSDIPVCCLTFSDCSEIISGALSDIHSDMPSDILSVIYSGVTFDIMSGITFGIWPDIAFWHDFWLGSGIVHCDLERAVGVREGHGDHLHTWNAITCTQRSLVHIRHHLYTWNAITCTHGWLLGGETGTPLGWVEWVELHTY